MWDTRPVFLEKQNPHPLFSFFFRHEPKPARGHHAQGSRSPGGGPCAADRPPRSGSGKDRAGCHCRGARSGGLLPLLRRPCRIQIRRAHDPAWPDGRTQRAEPARTWHHCLYQPVEFPPSYLCRSDRGRAAGRERRRGETCRADPTHRFAGIGTSASGRGTCRCAGLCAGGGRCRGLAAWRR